MENETLATQIHTHAMKRVLFNLTVLLLIALIIRVGYLATTTQPGEALPSQSSSPLPTPERRTPSYAQPDSLATDSVQLYSQRHDASRGAFWFGIR